MMPDKTNFSFPQEHILKLNLSGQRELSLICTNADLRELVVGYLKNEGVIDALEQLKRMTISPDGATAEVLRRARGFLCGGAVQRAGRRAAAAAGNADAKNCQSALFRLVYPRLLRGGGRPGGRYQATGGTHASALFNGRGMLCFFEDVGRHNTLDKLAGDCLLRGVSAEDTLLITTGRISSDMARKAGGMGVSAIASYSTATDMAYEAANKAGMTLIGHVKQQPMQVFCHEERIITDGSSTHTHLRPEGRGEIPPN